MKCPKCGKNIRQVRREITNNLRVGNNFKEYDKKTYECKEDDVWVSIEIPIQSVGKSTFKKN